VGGGPFAAALGALLVMAARAPSAAALSAPPTVLRTLARGSFLRVSADLSGGLPLDHWKTRSVRHPREGPLEALCAVWTKQGGLPAYWAGLPAKLVEGFCCGGLLLAVTFLLLAIADCAPACDFCCWNGHASEINACETGEGGHQASSDPSEGPSRRGGHRGSVGHRRGMRSVSRSHADNLSGHDSIGNGCQRS